MKLIILRGLPGSGKSTYVRNHLNGAVVCSADHFFINPKSGEYIYDPSKIGDAHRSCFKMALALMQNSCPLVVIDNTNLTKWEISPYMALGSAYNYECEIVTINCEPDVCVERNVHGVPKKTIERMHETLQKEKLLPRWKHIEENKKVAMTFKEVPEFEQESNVVMYYTAIHYKKSEYKRTLLTAMLTRLWESDPSWCQSALLDLNEGPLVKIESLQELINQFEIQSKK